jgi:hypothetical protein
MAISPVIQKNILDAVRFLRSPWLVITVALFLSFLERNEDRTIEVSCRRLDNYPMLVKLGIPSPLAGRDTLLTSSKLSVGTILEADSYQDGSKFEVSPSYVVKTTAEDFSSTKEAIFPAGRIVGGDVQVAADTEVWRAAEAAHFDLRHHLASHALFWLETTESTELRAPLDKLNTDPSAVRNVRDASASKHLLLITGSVRVDSLAMSYMGAFWDPRSLAQHTLTIGTIYGHVTYDCPVSTGTAAENDKRSAGEVSLIYYLPVVYDAASGSVVADARASLPRPASFVEK